MLSFAPNTRDLLFLLMFESFAAQQLLSKLTVEDSMDFSSIILQC